MSVIPASSSMRINTGQNLVVYQCPSSRSHAFINIAIHNPHATETGKYSIAITTDTSTPSENNYFIHQVEIEPGKTVFFNRLVVGGDQNLHVAAVDVPINARLTSIEETSPEINDAGVLRINHSMPDLANVLVSSTAGFTLILNADRPDLVAISNDLILRNVESSPTEVEVSIDTGNGTTPGAVFLRETIPAGESVILDNMLLMPAEKLFVNVVSGQARVFSIGLAQTDNP